MASDRLAGTLISTGAALALTGMALSGFLAFFLYLLSFLSFGLVFLFGLYVARRRPEAQILAAGTLWFATVGGIPFVWISALAASFDSRTVLLGYLGLTGTMIALAGAGLKLAEPQGPARAPDRRLFARAAWLLGSGSLSLLLAGAVGYPGLSTPGYARLVWTAVLVVVGLWLHLGAWIALFAATNSDYRERTATPRLNRGRFAWTVSVLSFIAAIYLGPWYRPLFGEGSYFVPFLPFAPPFPFDPAVFAPVVLCHAFIFHRYSRFVPQGGPRTSVTIGALAITAAAIIGLIGLFVYYAPANLPSEAYWWLFLPFPAGSTAIGYGLVFRGYQRAALLERGAAGSASPTLSG